MVSNGSRVLSGISRYRKQEANGNFYLYYLALYVDVLCLCYLAVTLLRPFVILYYFSIHFSSLTLQHHVKDIPRQSLILPLPSLCIIYLSMHRFSPLSTLLALPINSSILHNSMLVSIVS